MADPLYTFDRRGMEALARDHRRLQHQIQNLEARLRAANAKSSPVSVYLAKTPAGGVPAASGAAPGVASCEVWGVRNGSLQPLGFACRVANPTSAARPAGELVKIVRDGYGSWWLVSDDPLHYVALTGSGVTGRNGATPGTGVVTLYARIGGALVSTSSPVTVFNHDEVAVGGNLYVDVVQDGFGVWWVIPQRGAAFAAKVTESGGIGARSGASPGSGELTLYQLVGGTLTAMSATVTAHNLGAALAQDAWVLVIRDNLGAWWILAQPTAGYDRVRVTVNADFDSGDASVAATVQSVRNGARAEVNDVITVQNHPTHTAGVYLFEGDSGDVFTAVWSEIHSQWDLIQGECPE